MTTAEKMRHPERDADRVRYDFDIYSWAIEQARLIRAGRLDELDRENLAEEIESLGRSERSALISYMALVLQHMLKWDFQSELRNRGWIVSINAHRNHFQRQLAENPGLKSQLPAVLESAYRIAAGQAAAETGLHRGHFPARCPYTLDEALERPFAFSDLDHG